MFIHFSLRIIYDSMHMGQQAAFIFWFHLSKCYGVIIFKASLQFHEWVRHFRSQTAMTHSRSFNQSRSLHRIPCFAKPLRTTFGDKTIEFMFADINMFWARLRLILARAVRRGLKWALRRAQNIFMPKNINSITIIITLEGIERINTEKMTTKRSEEYFFQPRSQGLSPLPPLSLGKETLVAAGHLNTQNLGGKKSVGRDGWQSVLIVAVVNFVGFKISSSR